MSDRALTHIPAVPVSQAAAPVSALQPRSFEETEPAQVEGDRWAIAPGSASSSPVPPPDQPVRHSFGDVAVLPIQPSLTIGQPNDPYEQEADRVADLVMRIADPPPPVQRQDGEEVGPDIRRSPDSAQPVAPQPNLETRLNASRSGGSPLPKEVRQFMEPRFGFNFSQVKVHTDTNAVQLNRDLGAQAFAHGNHIYYSAGKTAANDHLTGHELTHVVQQSQGSASAQQPHLATAQSTPTVQCWGRRELEQRQRAQPWDTATIDQPLGENDPSIELAIRANQALEFSPHNLGLVRMALGLPRRPLLIERRFVQAVRRFQLGGAVIETDLAGFDAEGRRPTSVSESFDGSGVLDRQTLMRLDWRSIVNRQAARRAYQGRPWNRFSEPEIASISATLAQPLGIDANDLRVVTLGRGRSRVEVSDRCLERVAAWQIWTRHSALPTGTLDI